MPKTTAPHNLPSDGSANPGQTSAANPHVQYPFAELHARDANTTTSGGHEGNATDNPTGE